MKTCRAFECWRGLYNTSIDTDELSKGSKNDLDDLMRTLQYVARPLLEDGNGAGLKQISQLVLCGESAGNKQLELALKTSLNNQPGNRSSTISYEYARISLPLLGASPRTVGIVRIV